MKTVSGNFGVEELLTLLLPGVLVAAGVALIVDSMETQREQMMQFARQAQFVASFLLIAVTLLLGAIVASIHAALETWVLDPITRRRLNLDNEAYMEHWYSYLRGLNEARNAYIARVFLFFQFETRLALGGAFLGCALLPTSACAGALIVLASVLLYLMGAYHHKELGAIRRALFSE
jgi:hypothetical protein